MRQIKFRAWDGSRNKMQTSPKFVEFNFSSDGELFAKNYAIGGALQMLPVMQFTGLLDANSVEIYEGDIVDWVGGIFYIMWEDSDASFFAVRSDEVFAESGQELADSCVVIGNIHQHPELLK